MDQSEFDALLEELDEAALKSAGTYYGELATRAARALRALKAEVDAGGGA